MSCQELQSVLSSKLGFSLPLAEFGVFTSAFSLLNGRLIQYENFVHVVSKYCDKSLVTTNINDE